MTQHGTATEVKEKPILFTGPMVRAILEGRKTMTRRVVKPQLPTMEPPFDDQVDEFVVDWGAQLKVDRHGEEYPGPEVFGCWHIEGEWGRKCPYGGPGDHLWVRETWCGWTRTNTDCGEEWDEWGGPLYEDDRPNAGVTYRADDDSEPSCWRPSIHMPRWASRITLEVTGVRVERVQEISEEDAKAEGIERHDDDGVTYYGPLNKGHACPRYEFQRLWDSINAKRGFGWDSNPWVWVIEFKVLEVKG